MSNRLRKVKTTKQTVEQESNVQKVLYEVLKMALKQ